MSLLSQIWQNNCAFFKEYEYKSGFSKASFDCTILFQHQDYLLMWFFVISVLSFCKLLRLQGDVHWGPLPVCPDLPGEVFGRVRRLWAGRLGGPRSQGTQGLPPQRSRPHEQGTIQRVSCVLTAQSVKRASFDMSKTWSSFRKSSNFFQKLKEILPAENTFIYSPKNLGSQDKKPELF